MSDEDLIARCCEYVRAFVAMHGWHHDLVFVASHQDPMPAFYRKEDQFVSSYIEAFKTGAAIFWTESDEDSLSVVVERRSGETEVLIASFDAMGALSTFSRIAQSEIRFEA